MTGVTQASSDDLPEQLDAINTAILDNFIEEEDADENPLGIDLEQHNSDTEPQSENEIHSVAV